MDQKIAGIGIGAMFVIGLFTMMGFALAQDTETSPATGFTDADNDGVCDYAGECPHKERAGGFVDGDGDGVCDHKGQREGCHGSEGCSKMKEGFRGGCHRAAE